MSADAPGFLGKVPSHGDFVSRRLPPPLARRWDDWLQSCIVASKQELGAAWLSTYMTSPLWRFALSGDGAGGAAWAGVLMPSVDRVGRHFPLMIGAALGLDAGVFDVLDHGKRWHDAIEALALSALDENFQLARFDAPLPLQFDPPLQDSLPLAVLTTADIGKSRQGKLAQGQWCFPIDGIEHLTSMTLVDKRGAASGAASVANTWRSLPAGSSLWWTDGSPAVAPSLLVCAGLPPPSLFAALLDGRWREHGWEIGGSGEAP